MTMKNTAPAAFRQSHAFTMVEVLMATTIGALVLCGAGAFLITSLKIYSADFNRLNVNNDLRSFTLRMETDAAFANIFYIYDPATNGAIPNTNTKSSVSAGQSGDLVLLVTVLTANNGSTTVDRIVAYSHNSVGTTNAPNDTGPLYRWDSGPGLGVAGTTGPDKLYNVNVAPGLNAVIAAGRQFMPTATVVGVAQNSAAFPAAAHPNLFYYLCNPATSTGNGAFMVQSQIKEQQNNQTVLAIDTYNFTIWPRS
jgi:prepilin-type N-terminal cleavage/methylation domain-containing protein